MDNTDDPTSETKRVPVEKDSLPRYPDETFADRGALVTALQPMLKVMTLCGSYFESHEFECNRQRCKRDDFVNPTEVGGVFDDKRNKRCRKMYARSVSMYS